MHCNHLHFLNASDNFTADAIKNIKHQTELSLNKIYQYLPKTSLDIIFQHAPKATIPNEYIGGRCTNSSTIFIYFDTEYDNFNHIIQNELKKTLAHEHHHASRWKSVGYGQSLGEAIITEGLADHFSQEVFKTDKPQWCKALGSDEITQFLQMACLELNNTNYNHFKWFFGTKEDIPRWAGYSIGYHIIEQYLNKTPNASAYKLVDTKASHILSDLAL